MTEKDTFEKEQNFLREKFYYNPEYGNKLALFHYEMTSERENNFGGGLGGFSPPDNAQAHRRSRSRVCAI